MASNQIPKISHDEWSAHIAAWRVSKLTRAQYCGLTSCLEEPGDDAAFIAKALGNIARARGMTQLATDTGLGRESLYKALSGDGNPSFETIQNVTRALGLQFHVERMAA